MRAALVALSPAASKALAGGSEASSSLILVYSFAHGYRTCHNGEPARSLLGMKDPVR